MLGREHHTNLATGALPRYVSDGLYPVAGMSGVYVTYKHVHNPQPPRVVDAAGAARQLRDPGALGDHSVSAPPLPSSRFHHSSPTRFVWPLLTSVHYYEL